MRGVLLVTCITVACAHQARPPPLTVWQELRSEHFLLTTDLTPAAARITLQQLESFRTALQSSWLTPADTPDSAEVIVLADTRELRMFTDWSGLATVTGPRPLIVTSGASATGFREELPASSVVAHELTHVLARWRTPGVAPWFEEGLAEFLGTLRIRDQHVASFGGRGFPPVFEQAATPSFTSLSVDQNGSTIGGVAPPPAPAAIPEPLIGLDELDSLPWQFSTPFAGRLAYRSARAWVQALQLRAPARMRALELALRQGVPWKTAWAEARRGLDVAALEEVIRGWLAGAPLGTEEHSFTPPVVEARERTLPVWEVRLVVAQLWILGASSEDWSERLGRARVELEAAVSEAPAEALPRVRLARLEPDPRARLSLAESIARAHPDSPEAAVFLAATLREDDRDLPGRGEAIARAVALAPEDPDALTASAVEQARTGQVPAALRTVERAVAVAPWSPIVFRVQANLLASVGRCDEALDSARRAQGLLSHRASSELVAAVDRDLQLITRRCSRAQAPASERSPVRANP